MAVEAKAQIRNNYGTKFMIKGKKEYKTLLPTLTVEDEIYWNDLNDYIIDRLKVITMNEPPHMKQKSYLEALKGKEKDNLQEKVNEESSKTIKNKESLSKNNSDITNEEIEDMMYKTENSTQMKIIKEL